MNILTTLTLLLTALTVVLGGKAVSKGQLKRSGHKESVKRRGLIQPVHVAQRGRKKSIWSYNPGHRSLAFLVAGDIYTVSPPPVDPGTGDYRCLGCCGDKVTVKGKVSAAPKISNRVSRIVSAPEGLGDLGTEPNAINDRCLGCCEESVTPSLTVTAMTQKRTTSGTQKGATATIKRAQQVQRRRGYKTPCTPPKCNPDWRYEASSSSEEVPMMRPRRLQPLQLRSGNRCRHLGCRSALGVAPDSSSSSSSEED